MNRGPALPRSGYLLLAGITLFWGANWPAMKIVLGELPIWWFRSLCLLVGGIGLLLAEPLTRRKVAALGLVLGETVGAQELAAVFFPSAARPSAPA